MNYDLKSRFKASNLKPRLYSKTCLTVFFFALFFLPYQHTLALQSQESFTTSLFSAKSKKRVAIFPFRNNTDIPHLQESIPDLLRGGLFKTGFLCPVEQKKLYRTAWRLSISDLIKIDNAGVISRDRFLSQEVDLLSRLKREEIERISGSVDADYAVIGAANQFGDLIRIELELFNVYTNRTLDSMSAELNDAENIPNTINDFVPVITALCEHENVEEIVDDIVGRHSGGLITFDTTVSCLKEVVLRVPVSIYAGMQLLILYKERKLNSEVVEICKSIVSTIIQHNYDVLDILSRFGEDPFDILASSYDTDNRLQDAADVYTNAIKIVPIKTAYYYKKLGMILFRQGNTKNAIKAFNRSIDLDLTDFEVRYQLGIAYESIGQNSEALKQYRKCLKYSGRRTKDLPIEILERKIDELERLR